MFDFLQDLCCLFVWLLIKPFWEAHSSVCGFAISFCSSLKALSVLSLIQIDLSHNQMEKNVTFPLFNITLAAWHALWALPKVISSFSSTISSWDLSMIWTIFMAVQIRIFIRCPFGSMMFGSYDSGYKDCVRETQRLEEGYKYRGQKCRD